MGLLQAGYIPDRSDNGVNETKNIRAVRKVSGSLTRLNAERFDHFPDQPNFLIIRTLVPIQSSRRPFTLHFTASSS